MKYLLLSTLALFLLLGCNARRNDNIVVKRQFKPTPVTHIKPIQQPIHKKPVTKVVRHIPKKRIKLKEVHDNNYEDAYMYPEDTAAAKKDPSEKKELSPTATGNMNKDACIAMIGQEKFDRYTNMFGSEAASIKRCAMLQAMNK